ncbi:hypothetical protein [Heyndrickxia coagulans]|nr:hypothetical protein [Heyndrickxia coagulans]
MRAKAASSALKKATGAAVAFSNGSGTFAMPVFLLVKSRSRM